MTQAVPTGTIDLPTDDTSVYEAAVTYAGLGFSVIPLHGVVDGRCTCSSPDCEERCYGKHPVAAKWQNQASADIDVVREIFRTHRYNIGIMLGPEYVVLDVDGPRGFESLAQLGDLPPTLTSRSGSGVGEHRIYAYAPHHDPNEVTNRTILPKLDVKTRAGQIVVAPSQHRSGYRYQWVNAMTPATLPDHIYEQIRKPTRAPSAPVHQDRDNQGDLYARAVSYVAKIPPAISGSGGHAQTFDAARALAGWVSKGLSEADAWGILCDYNSRCQPPWGEHELKHKFRDAMSATKIPVIEDRPRPMAIVSPITPKPKPTTDPLPASQPARAKDPDWRSRLIWEATKTGQMRPAKHEENAIVVLRYHPQWAGRVRLDTHSQNVTVANPPWHESDRPLDHEDLRCWTDTDTARLSSWIRREVGVDIGVSACDRAVAVAAESSTYHPVKDYFDALVWDQTPRLTQAPARYFGAASSPYTSLVMRWWMIAGAARTYQPGCKADNVLILEGAQGLRKSSALRVLAGQKWFSDTPLDLASKDAYMSLNGKLIVELAELESLRKADAARAKSFFTSAVDEYRPPYGRRNVKVPRSCIFAGTVNHASYLQDPTGNRRYWPIACTNIDLDAIERDRDQLWAEAVYWFKQGMRWWPTTIEELAICEDAQAPRVESDEWEDPIARWLDAQPRTPTIGDVLQDVLRLERGHWGRSEQMRVSSILQRLGYERRQVREGATRVWRYERRRQSPNPKAA